jgi:hypothetical protein
MRAITCTLLCAAAASLGGGANAAATEQSAWMSALSAAYVVVDVTSGDVDGDGKNEMVACYREDVGRSAQTSGIVILAGKGSDQKPVFHVQLHDVLCEKVRVSGRKVGILLAGNQQLTWTYGEQIRFRNDKGGLYQAATVKGSSTAAPQYGAEKAIDADLSTSWAEGATGTGIGQSWTIRFAKPTDVSALGIFAGRGDSARAFTDHNRIHRASIEAKTEADLGDASAGLDFSSLGIDSMGDRSEFSCENRPSVTYVRVDRRGVVELQIRIESVYLGDKRDETHIAEIDVVPLLSLSETVDRATAVKAREPETKKKAPEVKLPDGDDALKRLDESKGSVVPDDF